MQAERKVLPNPVPPWNNRFIERSEKLLPGFTVPRALRIVAGAAIVSFGLYNVHRQSGITEGGVLGTVLLLHHWFGWRP